MFKGEVLFLDRDDINTDEIIPAKYLTEIYKKELQPYLFEELSLEGFTTGHSKGKSLVVARSNFGCGSSREHAVWVLEVNGITVAVAENFARIFRQNMYNSGLLPVELPAESIEEIFSTFSSGTCEGEVKLEEKEILFTSAEVKRTYPFEISGFHLDLIREGGWVEYANKRY